MRIAIPEEYRRNLPHIQPQGGMFFVTFRLQGSIPMATLKEWNQIYKLTKTTSDEGETLKQLKLNQQEDYFFTFDEYLDLHSNGPYYLHNTKIISILEEALHFRNSKDYKLVCYCIMCNHVHLIIYNLSKPLSKILQELKSFTGREALKIIRKMNMDELHLYNSTGIIHSRFWQAESFDRLVRDRKDMATKIQYTLNNPVNAGLVSYWKHWKWSYCAPEYIEY